MIITIKPMESLIFGDGKPFNAGENIFRNTNIEILNTVVYPLIKEFQGCLRFISFYQSHVSAEIALPYPMDWFYKLIKIPYKNEENFILIPRIKDKLKSVLYIKSSWFENYLLLNYKFKNKRKKISFLETIKFVPYNIQKKVGIELNRKNRNTKEGKLYFQEETYFSTQKLFENIEILIFLENSNANKFNKSYFIKLGGEKRLVKVNINNSQIERLKNLFSLYENIKTKIQKTKYFKIVLLTPTNYPPKIKGAKRIAQLTNKPITFSGWFNVYNGDKKTDSFPSRLFKLIPAGSVFYYKINDDIARDEKKLEDFLAKLFNNYWLKPSFFVPEYPYFEKTKDGTNPLGFGLSIIGVAQVEE